MSETYILSLKVPISKLKGVKVRKITSKADVFAHVEDGYLVISVKEKV